MQTNRFLTAFWALAKPYWVSEQRAKGFALLAAVIGLALALVWINVQLNAWNNDFYNAIQEKKIDDFYRLLGTFTLLVFAYIGIAVYRFYLQQMLQIEWRTWLNERFLAAWLTHKIGKPLIGLDFNQQRYEADYRFSLVRLRENSEGVALYRGENEELANFRARFAAVISNWWGIMRKQKQLNFFTISYAQLAIIFPFVVAAPRYFSGAIQLGGLMQIASTFGYVQGSLSWRSEEHTSELQSPCNLVCRLLLEKKKKNNKKYDTYIYTQSTYSR